MGQPSIPPLGPPLLQPPAPPLPGGEIGAAPCQVRCAGCRLILSVAPGVTKFVCPSCELPQMLPPELTRPLQFLTNPNPTPTSTPTPNPISTPNPNPDPARAIGPPKSPNPSAQAHGIDPTKIQLPCANCKAILNVPYGLARFKCPQCAVNEVAIEVECEEDEGGLVGETFIDYDSIKMVTSSGATMMLSPCLKEASLTKMKLTSEELRAILDCIHSIRKTDTRADEAERGIVIGPWPEHNYLPSKLWVQILSRLPMKSIVRCRSVSRSWRSLIDDSSFKTFNNEKNNHSCFLS